MAKMYSEEEERWIRRWEIFWRPFWIAVIVFGVVLLFVHHFHIEI